MRLLEFMPHRGWQSVPHPNFKWMTTWNHRLDFLTCSNSPCLWCQVCVSPRDRAAKLTPIQAVTFQSEPRLLLCARMKTAWLPQANRRLLFNRRTNVFRRRKRFPETFILCRKIISTLLAFVWVFLRSSFEPIVFHWQGSTSMVVTTQTRLKPFMFHWECSTSKIVTSQTWFEPVLFHWQGSTSRVVTSQT